MKTKRFCECWHCRDAGPGRVCAVCGLPPEPGRMNLESEREGSPPRSASRPIVRPVAPGRSPWGWLTFIAGGISFALAIVFGAITGLLSWSVFQLESIPGEAARRDAVGIAGAFIATVILAAAAAWLLKEGAVRKVPRVKFEGAALESLLLVAYPDGCELRTLLEKEPSMALEILDGCFRGVSYRAIMSAALEYDSAPGLDALIAPAIEQAREIYSQVPRA